MQGRWNPNASGGVVPRDDGHLSQRRMPMEPEEDQNSYDEHVVHPDDEPSGEKGEGGAGDKNIDATGGEDAVLDLAELEQLQEEAERMKGLGNKHMAAQVSRTRIISVSVLAAT